MLPSIKRRLAALGPVAIPFADTTPGIWLLETQRPAPAKEAANCVMGVSSTEGPNASVLCPTPSGASTDVPGGKLSEK
jgi:hypothetical protein